MRAAKIILSPYGMEFSSTAARPPCTFFKTQISGAHAQERFNTNQRTADTVSQLRAASTGLALYAAQRGQKTNMAGLEPALWQAASHELVEEGALRKWRGVSASKGT